MSIPPGPCSWSPAAAAATMPPPKPSRRRPGPGPRPPPTPCPQAPKSCKPCVARGGQARVGAAIDADGKLGDIQPVGIGPGAPPTPGDNHDIGVGAFLMAGSEVLSHPVDPHRGEFRVLQ